MKKSVSLSIEELKELKVALRSSYITSMTLFLMVMTLVHIIIFVKSENWIIPYFEILLLIGSLAITYFSTLYYTKDLRNEIKNGLKIIELNPIEKKYNYLDKQDRLSSEFTQFVIIAGGQKYIVTEEQFEKAKIPGNIAVHLTPIREIILKTEIITSP